MISALALRFTRTPAVAKDRIDGALEIMNQTPDVMDLTLIVVAVNEIGKAFVLGYENFEFPATAQRDITFGSTLPTGSYVVHVDAVGEVPGKYAIFRTRLQTDRLHTQ